MEENAFNIILRHVLKQITYILNLKISISQQEIFKEGVIMYFLIIDIVSKGMYSVNIT